ncbi:hypothetical protein HK097_009946 [Rhizophlyctis rosea]|uniref:Uncharacterized protein n=1 Tax=Rhizophlyctis rosea TaxID=64517 RepID=A0AAD5SIX9_9FUNG|nr:hypothetical protein HK097_009946 [Rhizophlyctis rosea]
MIVDEDEILKTYFEERKIDSKNDRIFLTEAFHGCVRHRKIVEIATLGFLFKFGGQYLRAEYNLFAILTYLALYRLNDLTFSNFRNFIICHDPVKMARLIAFLFDPANLLGDDRPEADGERKSDNGDTSIQLEDSLVSKWSKVVGMEYVQEQLVDPILAHLADAGELLAELCEKCEKGMQPEKSGKAPTEPEPFLLTVPTPRRLPASSAIISRTPKARPVPKSIYTGTGEKERLEKLKQENREKMQELYAKAQNEQFAVLSRKTISKTQKHQSTAVSTPAETPTLRIHRPVPATIHTAVPVKLTTAAILREESLMKKQRKEEEKSLAGLELGLSGRAEFEEWKEEQRLKEEEERKTEMERRRLEIQLIHEEAFEAKQDVLKENRQTASTLQTELNALKSLSTHLSHLHHLQNRALVTSIQSLQPAIHLARSQIISSNHSKAQILTSEKEEMRAKAQKEAQEELERKMELIAQIRLLERSVPKVGEVVKMVDLTETSGVGLLGEMSVVELQERLILAKNRERDWESAKRAEIIEQKQAKVDEIAKKLQDIEREREDRRRARKGRASVDADMEGYEVGSLGSLSPTPSSASVGRSEKLKSSLNRDPVVKELQAKLEVKKAARLAQQKAPPSLPTRTRTRLTNPSRPISSLFSSSTPSIPSPTSTLSHPSSPSYADLDAAENAYRLRRQDLRAQQERLLEEIARDQKDTGSDGDAESNDLDDVEVREREAAYGRSEERKGGMVRV